MTPQPCDSCMSEPTREEVDAKLAATEARLETRLTAIDGKLDRLFDRVELAVAASQRAESSAGNIKWNIIFTALGVLAVLLAVWAVWAQGVEMVGTLLGAFPSGQ